MSYPQIGDPAPEFTLPNQRGEPVRLSDYRGKYVVVYFYPKALTPGCTTQACALRDSAAELEALGAVVLGVSPDPVARLQKFIDKHELNFDLLADEDHQLAETYGVWGLKKFMGKEFMGIKRTTFVIDRSGNMAAVLDSFKTKDHHQVLLNWLQTHAKV